VEGRPEVQKDSLNDFREDCPSAAAGRSRLRSIPSDPEHDWSAARGYRLRVSPPQVESEVTCQCFKLRDSIVTSGNELVKNVTCRLPPEAYFMGERDVRKVSGSPRSAETNDNAEAETSNPRGVRIPPPVRFLG